jgi:hypothetical protein
LIVSVPFIPPTVVELLMLYVVANPDCKLIAAIKIIATMNKM